MATTVHDFGESDAKTEFSGSNSDDVAFAKTFWQSVQLLPTMESRLVSSHMKQRLKVAPPGHQPVNYTYPQFEIPNKLKTFFIKAGVMQSSDQSQKISKLIELKKETKDTFKNLQDIRKEKEKISQSVRQQRQSDRVYKNSNYESTENTDSAEDINIFNEKLAHGDFSRN